MKVNLTQSLGLVVASCLALASSAFAAGHGAGHGNSSFGHNQRTNLQTGPGNSSFGRTTAENARLRSNDLDDDADQDVVRTKKMKKQKATNPGNSAFGRSQRVNHLKGSGNNVYGKTTSAKAKSKHALKKADRD
jgi:hypothetical protein